MAISLDLETPLYKAIFISEAQGRFRCTIRVNGKLENCYVPLTCKIEKLVPIKKGTNLLVLNTDKKSSRYPFTLFTASFGRNRICLNGNYTNRIAYYIYCLKYPDALREVMIEDYKSDIWIPSEKKIIEAKTIISIEERVVIPNYRSDRFLGQLDKIDQLLQEGYKIDLCYITFSKTVKEIIIDRQTSIGEAIVKCLAHGLQITSYYAFWGSSKFTIKKGPQLIV